MRKIVEYRTIDDLIDFALDSKVNAMLRSGFEPHGNPYATPDGHLAQAMVRYGEVSK